MTAFFGSRHIAVGALLASVLLVEARDVEAYVYCGFHDRGFPMRAFHFNSEFWVDQLADEVARWNTVHPVIQLSRERRSTVPVMHATSSSLSAAIWSKIGLDDSITHCERP